MKIKRKVPVFSLILQRVIESRFPEIESIRFSENCNVELHIHPQSTTIDFDQFFWPYLHRLAEEFAEPGCHYQFELLQHGRVVSTMKYSEETIYQPIC